MIVWTSNPANKQALMLFRFHYLWFWYNFKSRQLDSKEKPLFSLLLSILIYLCWLINSLIWSCQANTSLICMQSQEGIMILKPPQEISFSFGDSMGHPLMAGLSFVHFCLCCYFLPTQIACQMFLEAAWSFSFGTTRYWMLIFFLLSNSVTGQNRYSSSHK